MGCSHILPATTTVEPFQGPNQRHISSPATQRNVKQNKSPENKVFSTSNLHSSVPVPGVISGVSSAETSSSNVLRIIRSTTPSPKQSNGNITEKEPQSIMIKKGDHHNIQLSITLVTGKEIDPPIPVQPVDETNLLMKEHEKRKEKEKEREKEQKNEVREKKQSETTNAKHQRRGAMTDFSNWFKNETIITTKVVPLPPIDSQQQQRINTEKHNTLNSARIRRYISDTRAETSLLQQMQEEREENIFPRKERQSIGGPAKKTNDLRSSLSPDSDGDTYRSNNNCSYSKNTGGRSLSRSRNLTEHTVGDPIQSEELYLRGSGSRRRLFNPYPYISKSPNHNGWTNNGFGSGSVVGSSSNNSTPLISLSPVITPSPVPPTTPFNSQLILQPTPTQNHNPHLLTPSNDMHLLPA